MSLRQGDSQANTNNTSKYHNLNDDSADISTIRHDLQRPILDDQSKFNNSILLDNSRFASRQKQTSIHIKPLLESVPRTNEISLFQQDQESGSPPDITSKTYLQLQNESMMKNDSKMDKSHDDDESFDHFTIRMNQLNRSSILRSHMLNQINYEAPPAAVASVSGHTSTEHPLTQVQIKKDLFPRSDSLLNHDQTISMIPASQPVTTPASVPGEANKSEINQPLQSNNQQQISSSQNNQTALSIIPAQPINILSISLVSRLRIQQQVRALVQTTSYRRFQEMKDNLFDLIGDLAMWRAVSEKKKPGSKLSLNAITESMTFKTFNPYSGIKLTWDMFNLLVMVFFFISVPLLLSTGLNFDQLYGPFPYYILSLILLIDALINVNTGYYKNGQLVVSKFMIFRNYFKKLLFIDFVGIVPLLVYTFLEDDTPKQILFCYFVKYKSVTKIFKRFELRLNLKASLLNKIALMKLFFTVLFIAHIFANFWLNLAYVNEDNWLTKLNLKNPKWYTMYSRAYYFITVTMVTVGYGDLSPINTRETIVSIVTILLSCAVFAYSVNSIGSILEEMNKEQKMLAYNMQIINSYMNKKKISMELRFLVREYLEFFYRFNDNGNVEQENLIIDQLAHNLKEKLFIEANSLILNNKIFSNKFSEQSLMKSLSIVKEFKFTPQQIIFSKNSLNDSSVYFVETGSVEIFLEAEKSEKTFSIQKLTKGQYFGEMSFFTGHEENISLRSVDFTTLLRIERSDFLEILKNFPKDEEMFHMIKDQVTQNINLEQNGFQCQICQKSDHLMSLCPMVQFVPNKYFCYRRYNYNPGQPRKSFQRQQKEKCSTLKDIDLIQEAALIIQDDYPDIFESNENDQDEFDSSFLTESDEDVPLRESISHQQMQQQQHQQQQNYSSFHTPKSSRNNQHKNFSFPQNNSASISSSAGRQSQFHTYQHSSEHMEDQSNQHGNNTVESQQNYTKNQGNQDPIQNVISENSDESDGYSEDKKRSQKQNRNEAGKLNENTSNTNQNQLNSKQFQSEQIHGLREHQKSQTQNRKDNLELNFLNNESHNNPDTETSQIKSLITPKIQKLIPSTKNSNAPVQQSYEGFWTHGPQHRYQGSQHHDRINQRHSANKQNNGQFNFTQPPSTTHQNHTYGNQGYFTAANPQQQHLLDIRDANQGTGVGQQHHQIIEQSPQNQSNNPNQSSNSQQAQSKSRFGHKLILHNNAVQRKQANPIEIPRLNVPTNENIKNQTPKRQQYHGQNKRESLYSSQGGMQARGGFLGFAQRAQIDITFETEQLVKKINAMHDKILGEGLQNSELILEFDKKMDYTTYFPKSNLFTVLSKLERIRKQGQKQQGAQQTAKPRVSFSFIEDDKIKSVLSAIFGHNKESPILGKQDSKQETASPRKRTQAIRKTVKSVSTVYNHQKTETGGVGQSFEMTSIN